MPREVCGRRRYCIAVFVGTVLGIDILFLFCIVSIASCMMAGNIIQFGALMQNSSYIESTAMFELGLSLLHPHVDASSASQKSRF